MTSEKKNTIPFLHPGQTIGLIAPARKISKQELQPAIEIIKRRGYKIHLATHIWEQENQFAGTDNQRAADLQQMIINPEIKAVFSVRGGYGSIRIVDKIDFTPLISNPKWLVGYSDFTVFHCHLSRIKVPTIHATMPINFTGNTQESLNSLFNMLEGKKTEYFFSTNVLNRNGKAKGKLIGGNLSVLYSLLGSDSFPETKGNILFIEDLDEYLYHIDRMMMALKRAGKLENLAGLLVGGMTQMHDNSVPFGKNAETIIHEIVSGYSYPVAFGFPAGHIQDNRAIKFGSEVSFTVANQQSNIIFI